MNKTRKKESIQIAEENEKEEEEEEAIRGEKIL